MSEETPPQPPKLTRGERRARRGQPSKLTPEIQAQIVKWLRLGNFFDISCVMADVSRNTGMAWLVRGRTAVKEGRTEHVLDAPFVAFAIAVDKARAEAEAADLAVIQLASKSDWKAAAWRLRARNPLRYGTRAEVGVDVGEQTDADGTVTETTTVTTTTPGHDDLTDEDFAVAARVVMRRRRERRLAAAGEGGAEPADDG